MKTLLFQESKLLVVILLVLSIFFKRFAPFFIIIFLLLLYFYRFPDRENLTQLDENTVVSPADGRIQSIQKLENGYTRIVIFLNIFDVHTQWSPVSGEIENIEYKEGTFHPAFMLKKSELNERCVTTIKHPLGIIYVRQIAGLIARRIVNWFKKNQSVERGEPMGMIKLSSRVDVDLPPKTKIVVKEGDYVYGNKSKLADLI